MYFYLFVKQESFFQHSFPVAYCYISDFILNREALTIIYISNPSLSGVISVRLVQVLCHILQKRAVLINVCKYCVYYYDDCIYRGYIMGEFVDVISATSERSERVADIISERMDKNHIQIHPLL